MKIALSIALSVLAALHAAAASAQVYQWKDGSGRTVISDTPPPASAKGSRAVDGRSPAEAPAAKTLAEKEMEFRKRRLEGKEKAAKEAKEQLAAAERKENCSRARLQLTELESTNPILALDDKGERRYMGEAERQQEAERTRNYMTANCK